jgi:AraC-like DNA-binding protein
MHDTVHITGTDRGYLPEGCACHYELVRSSSGLTLTSSTARTERACRWFAPSQQGTSIGILLQGRIGFSPSLAHSRQFLQGDSFLLTSRDPIETSHVVKQATEYRTVFLHLPEQTMEEFRLACVACGTMSTTLTDAARGLSLHRWTASREALVLADQIAACPFAGPLRTLYLQGKALELLAVMLASIDQDASSSGLDERLPAAHIERLTTARDILAAEFNTPPSLDALARRIGMSTSLLTAGFRRIFGVSVMAYVQEQRLNHAFAALREGSLNVSQAAYSSGYSRAYFSTLFRRKFGFSPRDLMTLDH